MPHSTAQNDAELAGTITQRLLRSAPEVCFSCARLRGKAEANPSHMIVAVAGHPVSPPNSLVPAALPQPLTTTLADSSTVPFPGTKAEGGAGTLTAQSQCPFRAFATARLHARDFDPAELGLDPRQRGDLVHAVLRSVWGGPAKAGFTSSDDLQAVVTEMGKEGLRAFVEQHVREVMLSMPASLRDRLSARYLQLEEQRLVTLVTEWLIYESTRARFTVVETEQKAPISVGGLGLDLRLDRRDLLDDGSSVIVDYKTGEADPERWATNRPQDVQLPLYAVFGVIQVQNQDPGGLVFAKVKTGKSEFSGRVRNCAAFLPDLGARHAMTKNPLTDEQLQEWRWTIETLAADFLQGRAVADPRDPSETCDHCAFTALCRVAENCPAGVMAG